MAEAFTLYKLIILYMLDKVDFPLTNSQISEFVLDKGYTDYFKLQQAHPERIHSQPHSFPSDGRWERDDSSFPG